MALALRLQFFLNIRLFKCLTEMRLHTLIGLAVACLTRPSGNTQHAEGWAM